MRLIISKDLLPVEVRENTLKKVSEVLSRFAKDGIPLLDPEEDMKVYLTALYLTFLISVNFFLIYITNLCTYLIQVQSSSYKKAIRRIEALETLFEKHEVSKSPLIEQKLKVLHMKQELTAKIKSIKKAMRSSTTLAFKDELKARKRVLRRLG